MNLRPVAAMLLTVLAFLGAPAGSARAQDDPPLSTNCQRADFLRDVAAESGARVVITDYIRNMAQQLCDSRPGAEPPPLRTIGDTYTVRPENPCQFDDQQPACIADHIEKVLYFRNRSPACREEFSRNAHAGRPEVTCPLVSDTPPLAGSCDAAAVADSLGKLLLFPGAAAGTMFVLFLIFGSRGRLWGTVAAIEWVFGSAGRRNVFFMILLAAAAGGLLIVAADHYGADCPL
ncbi:hypothetical protein Ait01nite_015450 [Actinoplanes italicus]|uniref:Integral membrane protein n=1 Tax=Actinoplanes italicus TaxID=113567 RepID=A0A2T0KHQ5_9ACTN|nr:hypothetical protein [Actinoplanes italicus]PRX22979.1 hypothetical protein CLV67_104507 [Actinoplanes italicus]GIE28500.1 hypothetical protein Ait01nite_015450 [Actinoplanes italicus]